MARYVIYAQSDKHSIRCGLCGRESYNKNDVTYRYCSFCHIFLEDMTPQPEENDDAKQLAQTLKEKAPKKGSLWRHYKGGLYKVITCTIMEDSLQLLVSYESMYFEGFEWTRTLDNFLQEFISSEGMPKQRFLHLRPLSKHSSLLIPDFDKGL